MKDRFPIHSKVIITRTLPINKNEFPGIIPDMERLFDGETIFSVIESRDDFCVLNTYDFGAMQNYAFNYNWLSLVDGDKVGIDPDTIIKVNRKKGINAKLVEKAAEPSFASVAGISVAALLGLAFSKASIKNKVKPAKVEEKVESELFIK